MITFYCISKLQARWKEPAGICKRASWVTLYGEVAVAHTQPDQSQTTASSFYSSLNFRFIKWTFSRDAAGQERRIPFTEKKKLVSTHVQKGGWWGSRPLPESTDWKSFRSHFLMKGEWSILKKSSNWDLSPKIKGSNHFSWNDLGSQLESQPFFPLKKYLG